MPVRRRPFAAAVLLVLALGGCGDDGRDVVGAGSPVRTSPPTSTSLEPTGTASATATTSSPAPAPAPSFPPAAAGVQQGDAVWAVYLAVVRVGEDGQAEDPSGDMARAREQAATAGYERDVGGGQVECDQGAREALGLDPDRGYQTASIFFATRADAEQFVAAYEPGVVGLAEIRAYCLD